MMSPLKRGTIVYLMRSYDDRGTFSIRRCTVRSSGPKQTHLITSDGSNFEERIYTDCANRYWYSPYIFPVEEIADPHAKACELASTYLARTREEYAERLARWGDEPGYRTASEQSMAQLHEPRVVELQR